ncbi:TIGR04219 family outer membrane beta-barrel protein [Hydrogenimonas sp. SS33]|uniref:TIGR04219 family outer membrane beta-barrel protein n=1 Tax=Hydrogenimonas leucolamina TaxID=2954236 RepID=UPI00336C24E1
MAKRLSLFACAALLTAGISANADTLGGEIAIGGWNHDPSGWVKYPNDVPDDQSKVDADDDLNLDTETDLYVRAKLEHPVPILPNIRLAYVKTESEGDGTISRDFTFGDITVGVSDKIHSEASLKNYDATFYYELLDNDTVGLDLGITARYLDGYVKVTDKTTGESDSHDIDFVVPMVYAGARIALPFLEGLSVGAEGSGITYDGSTLFDIQGDLRYTFGMGLGAEAGYRWQKVKLDDVDDSDADIDIKGFYAGLVWDF